MFAPFAAIEETLSQQSMKLLADVVVTRSDGTQFLARTAFRDKELFDRHALANDRAIDYREADAPEILPGERLTLNGVSYTVQGDPEWINQQEKRAQIVEAD